VKGWLICAQQPRRKRLSCKGQFEEQDEQALVSLQIKETVDAGVGRTQAVIIVKSAKRLNTLGQRNKNNGYQTVIRHFAMKCPPSARVDNFSIRKAN